MRLTLPRRRTILACGAAVCAIALVAVTWLLARTFQSPEQRAAQARPPAAQAILVPVTRTDLVERTTVKARVAAAQARTLTLPTGEGTSVVTQAGVDAGATLANGQVLTWVNDRPVIALSGPFPFYRDLGPGDHGSDVRALQQALTSLGYGVRADGRFGPATARALRSLYRQVGATAPTRTRGGEGAGTSPTSDGQAGTGTQPASSQQSQQAQTATPSGGHASETYLPAREVAVISGLPATVEVAPPVGTVLAGDNARVQLAAGGLSLLASVSGPTAARMHTGMTATASVADASLDVTVTEVRPAGGSTDSEQGSQGAGATDAAGGAGAATPASAGADGADPNDPAQEGEADTFGQDGSGQDSEADTSDADAASAATSVTLVLTPTSGSVPPDWRGRSDILVTLDLITPLTDVLTVPQRALAAQGDGRANVLLRSKDGTFRTVTVTQKTCVDGTCAIEADSSTGVVDGAQVRVDRP